MHKLLIAAVFIAAIGSTIALLNQNASPKATAENKQAVVTTSSPITSASPTPTNFTAQFEIYTNGTKRIFTASMYHNLSEEIYIENPNPNLVQVKKAGTTWQDFFDTLPFSLSKDCLVTGTQQTFCTNEKNKLRFFLNDQEEPQALDREIMPNDTLLVRYGD